MPKDDPEEETLKKRPVHDDEDQEFDKEIEGSMEDEDPLDQEDPELSEEISKAGSKEVFSDEEDVPAVPKPTFKYNVEEPTLPPSDNPVMTKHTLDDLSEDEIAPQPSRKPFEVDRGMTPQAAPAEDDFENTYPSRPQRPPLMQQEEYEHDNLSIPSIRKQTPLYPPHPSRDEQQQSQQPRQSNNPYREASSSPYREASSSPYAADQSQRFGYREASSSAYREASSSAYRDRQPKGASKWHIIILLLIGGAVIGATVYLLQNQFNFPGQTAEGTPAPSIQTAEVTPAPTPTPAPLERSQFKVRVLNGTTEAGMAKKVMDKIKELGYQPDRAGNAPKQDYTQSVIRVKEGDSTISAQLSKDLAPDYTPTISPDLDKADKADAEIILGEK